MFSIIVPSYNRNVEIAELLESLKRQTVYNFEVIVVDDCSKMPVEVNEEYPFNVNVIRNNPNVGAAQSRNVGASHANHEWLLFLDDDDRFMPEKCERLAAEITQNAIVNFVYHPAKCEMVNEGFTYVTRPFKDTKELTKENILKANKIGGMPMIGVKKELFCKIGGLSDRLRSLEDYDFLLKLLEEPGFSPLYVDEPLTYCTFHTKRASVSTDTGNTEKAIAYIEQTYIKTAEQAENFKLNSLYILSYPHIMNLSRTAAKYYFAMFKQTKNIKQFIIAVVICLSPKLAINLKRFL
ncbi:glycosyltransferase family 2 protein [Mannheimia sp. AT1]|uniref:Glycosyltransferase family 2 protein n=1 Tax=Mannheimia cairinae TaxID=3025936 RepID=A0ABT5MRR7_9PAST|nr:glycosyltransferase family 2 protein [Mannheimia cairinae]MDD0823538.1 glycosyltransferase family 2 protein [Mannheimia cairinae]MDD0826751.1 glycosyltransferase family 2 protein [Mannheimia cairinae]